MKAKFSRLLVIDASVARSAGETEHPVSCSCRNALLSIREICHRVIMTQPIQDEWDHHRSRFTQKWFRSMVARKKIQRSLGTRIDITDRILGGLSVNEQENLRKDLCLIEAACGGDGIIVTRDDTIIAIWQKCQERFGLPKAIRWINPVTDDRQILDHL